MMMVEWHCYCVHFKTPGGRQQMVKEKFANIKQNDFKNEIIIQEYNKLSANNTTTESTQTTTKTLDFFLKRKKMSISSLLNGAQKLWIN